MLAAGGGEDVVVGVDVAGPELALVDVGFGLYLATRVPEWRAWERTRNGARNAGSLLASTPGAQSRA